MKTFRKYLVVRADGEMRVRSRRARPIDLAPNEVAFPLTVKVPDGWGQVQPGELVVQMPDPPDATAEVGEPE